MDEIRQRLQEWGEVKAQAPLARYTTFKIGGSVDYLLVVSEIGKGISALDFLRAESIPFFILGGGSNMLVSDEGFRGVALHFACAGTTVEGNSITAETGCATVEVARISMKHNLTGFEWGVGVPGTIGGAVRGNAGAMGGETKNSVLSVDVYRDGEVISLTREECEFGYRHSLFKENNDVILRVRLGLSPADGAGGMKQALEYLSYRNRTQPKGSASTGCIFINPDFQKNREALLRHFSSSDEKVKQFEKVGKISAGWLIEHAGLKGLKKGRAEISGAHGNFIVNLGGATAEDVRFLIEDIQKGVYDRFGIVLEEEIQSIT